MELKLDKQKILLQMQEKNIKTQKELANKIGVSRSQFSQMLSEEYNPVKTNVDRLADVLHISTKELLKEKVDENKIKKNISFDRMDYRLDKYEEVKVVKPNKEYTVLETFAGAGGLALGLENAGFNTVGAIEIDKYAAETLRLNRPEWNIVEGDIENVAENLEEYINIKNLDLLSGGYPCQTFSYAGQRNGFADTRGTLFYPFSRILNELRPKIFIAENVKGLVNHDGGNTLETMIKVFKNEGYKVYWNVLNAWNYNVAQKRERIVIVGIRNDLVEKEKYGFSFPRVQEYKPLLKDVLKNVPNSDGIEYSEKKLEVMKLVPPGGCWINLPEKVAKEYMGVSWYSGGGKRGMARRISWDEPSLTLTTSPSQKQTERCHPDETRPFKIREYARIQSFPDNWCFAGGTSSIYKQIGNAVPVNLAEFIGKSIVNYLNQFK